MDTFPEDLRVSTMTAISKLSVHINLEKLYEHFEINDVIKFIEFRDKIPKGFSKKALKKKRKKEVKKVFFNQATLHIMCDKLVNVKIFNNGTIQMTGLKSIKQGKNVVNMYIEQLKKFNKEIYEGEIVMYNVQISHTTCNCVPTTTTSQPTYITTGGDTFNYLTTVNNIEQFFSEGSESVLTINYETATCSEIAGPPVETEETVVVPGYFIPLVGEVDGEDDGESVGFIFVNDFDTDVLFLEMIRTYFC